MQFLSNKQGFVRSESRLAQVGYIKLFIIYYFFYIILDISLVSFILIVSVWLV